MNYSSSPPPDYARLNSYLHPFIDAGSQALTAAWILVSTHPICVVSKQRFHMDVFFFF